ncbi:MAG TPA: hypothetical protein VH165_30395, partial [Kofleriaceae bacterium]|nr:hypothetical protein [Kofleriaceae bacterium]
MLLAVTTRPAHADWYNDASAIIEQVIEDDISTSVIPNAAARVPALCTYFPASIGAIQQKRYAGLHTVLRKELSDFVGDKIYLEVMALATPAAGVNPGATGSSSHINIKVLAAQKTAGKLSEQQLESATQQLTVASAAMTSRTPQVATSSTTCIDPTGEAMFAGLTSGATNQMSECAIVQPDVTQEAACAIGITVRDGMDGNNSMLVTDLQRVELAIEAEVKTQVPALDPQAFDAVRKSLQAILERLGTPSLLSADAAIAALIALGEVCNASPVCKKLAAWVDTSGAAADVGVIVGDIRRHDFGAAAKQVIGFAESLTCGDKCEDQDVLHFMSSLSVYVIDSVTSGQSAQSADGDFRAAA